MDPVSTILMLYVFPVQLVVGVAGNALNLVVLLSKGMRTKTNILLASMAFADICFLLFMIPHTFMYNNAVTQYHWMKWYNVYLNTHITGVANSFSIASAWFIVMVTIERLMVIMWPLKARNFWKTKRLVAVIALIWIASFTVTLHYHIAYEVHSENKTYNWIDANGTNCSRPMVRKQSRIRPGMGDYNKVAIIINILIVILIPLVVLATVNGLLVFCLRRQQKHMFQSTKGDRAGSNSDNNNVISNPKRQQRAQRKVTIMVIVIVSAFTVTNLPSAVIHLYELVRTLELNMMHIPAFQTAATIANSFVITGKTLNFFLFCMSSAHFRLRLLRIIARKAPAFVSCLHKFAPSVFPDPISEYQRGATNNSTRISTVHMMTTASPLVESPGHHSRLPNNGSRTTSSASNLYQVITVSDDNKACTSGRNRALNSDKQFDEEETSFSVVPLLSAPQHSQHSAQVRTGVGDALDKRISVDAVNDP